MGSRKVIENHVGKRRKKPKGRKGEEGGEEEEEQEEEVISVYKMLLISKFAIGTIPDSSVVKTPHSQCQGGAGAGFNS